MSLDPVLLQSETRLRELRTDAARRSLAALAACCQPQRWRTALTAVRDRLAPRAACC